MLEGKPQYVEFAGNLVPVTKSGDQLQIGFKAFRENRLPFTVRVKDPLVDSIGRLLFMREAKVSRNTINFYVKIMKLENEMKSQLTDFESFPRSFSSDSDRTFSSRLR